MVANHHDGDESSVVVTTLVRSVLRVGQKDEPHLFHLWYLLITINMQEKQLFSFREQVDG